MGNLMSVKRSFEALGFETMTSSDPNQIKNSSVLILPGVGAFKKAMFELKSRNLINPIKKSVENGTKILGICLGMQLLFEKSYEFGITDGLGLIPGEVIPIPKKSNYNEMIKIPHIGWNSIKLHETGNKINNLLFKSIKSDSEFYFIHSYMVEPSKYTAASCTYEGIPISALVTNDNVIGCQFHPEKSGHLGLKVIQNFLDICFSN
tara:strand:- start:3451 stop:4068 length:618 start_codon:yes stop_codon:yes gene_type:complete